MYHFKNILLCFLLILGGAVVINAQYWERTYGTTDFERGIDGVEVSTGDFLILCTGNESQSSIGAVNYLMKVNVSGNVLGRDTLEGLKAKGIETIDEGGFIVFGETTDQTYNRPFIKKYAANGLEEWTEYYRDTIDTGSEIISFITINDLVVLEDGGFMMHVKYRDVNTGSSEILLSKMNNEGSLVWEQPYQLSGSIANYDMERLADGNILMIGDYDNDLRKIDTSGNTIWYDESSVFGPFGPLATPTGGAIYRNEEFQSFTRINGDGNFVDWYEAFDPPHSVADLIALEDSSFMSTGSTIVFGDPNATYNFYMRRVYPWANASWDSKIFERPLNQYCRAIIETSDGGFLLIGYTEAEIGGDNIFLIKTNAEGIVGDHIVSGNIAHDLNFNCTIDSLEYPLAGFYVVAQGLDLSYGVSDSLGNYEIECNLGLQTISVFPPNNYWGFCDDEVVVNLTEPGDTTHVDFQAQTLTECPALEIDIASPFIRRCFNNTYYVSYCNNGTVTANDASIEVILDDYMVVTSTSIPLTANIDSLYIFDVGDLEVGDCGNFVINFMLDEDCDSTILGETHCVEAQAFPNDFCDVDTEWSGATVDLSAECNIDSLSFFIQNIGIGNMAGPLPYIIIEDEVVLLQGFFKLDAGEVDTISVPVNGSTYRLEAEQEPNHPSNIDVLSLTVEGCGVNDMGEISLGYVDLYPDNDDDPFLSIDCQQNVGSYDPNDKQAFPVGYGEDHFIDQNESIEYMIRFQNTGTDTAFNIVVLDTLSEFLNPLTVRPGASSHPYNFSIHGDGILSFSFDNIMLPDSNVNLIGSNGFFKFTVDQFPDNPIGTEILNSAAIYFDFNDPIITNTTWHTVGEDYILLSDHHVFLPNVNVKVFPNPFVHNTTFELEGISERGLKLEVYNAIGQLVKVESFENSRTILERNGLSTGIYFYYISNEEKAIASGKVVVH